MVEQKKTSVRGPNDAGRKDRIIRAAARVVGARGIEALTFRAVAAEAGVPLGSTTYYFKNKDDLFGVTIKAVRERNTALFIEMLNQDVAEQGLARGIATIIEEVTVHQREALVLEYGLFLAALHRPENRDEVARWRMEFVFDRFCDQPLAEALGYLVDGILLRAAMERVEFSAHEVEPLIERVMRSVSMGG